MARVRLHNISPQPMPKTNCKATQEALARITALSYQVSSETPHDVFVTFSGHVNEVRIRVFRDGWDKDVWNCDVIDHTISMWHCDQIGEFIKVIGELEGLLCPTD